MHAILSTLVHRAIVLCNRDSLHDELEFIKDTFRQNSYSNWQIHMALNPIIRVAPPKNKPDSVVFLPYVGSIFNLISKGLY
jgi:hypothetical protein